MQPGMYMVASTHLLDDVIQHEGHEEALANAFFLHIGFAHVTPLTALNQLQKMRLIDSYPFGHFTVCLLQHKKRTCFLGFWKLAGRGV